MSDLFGIGTDRRSSRSEGFTVRADIAQNSAKLAFAQMDYAAAPGARRLAKGDGAGAFALADAFEVAMRFEPAGSVGALTMSVSSYKNELGGVIGRAANAAAERRDNAALVAKEADARRAGVEGVNLDEELIALTTYQQSYNASARLIQAASEMYETLINMI
jgi:flagellar hook-associated protein 1 FlgK